MKKVLLAFILGLVLTMSFNSCSGGGGSDSIDPAWENKIKTMLLEHEEWIMEWSSDKGFNGLSYITFEDRGKKFVAKIDNRYANNKCERKVTIASEGIKMAGCRMSSTLMLFDSNDQKYPFKGEWQNITARLRVP